MAARVHRATMRGAYLVWEFVVPILALAMAAYAILSARPRIESTIRSEKVCTENNRGACQALFDRLAVNISRAQRQRLACDVTAYLSGPGILDIRRATHCPPPIHPPLRPGGG